MKSHEIVIDEYFKNNFPGLSYAKGSSSYSQDQYGFYRIDGIKLYLANFSLYFSSNKIEDIDDSDTTRFFAQNCKDVMAPMPCNNELNILTPKREALAKKLKKIICVKHDVSKRMNTLLNAMQLLALDVRLELTDCDFFPEIILHGTKEKRYSLLFSRNSHETIRIWPLDLYHVRISNCKDDQRDVFDVVEAESIIKVAKTNLARLEKSDD